MKLSRLLPEGITPLVASTVGPLAAAAVAGVAFGPISFLTLLILWLVLIPLGPIAAFAVSCTVKEHFGQPWAWASFWIVLAALWISPCGMVMAGGLETK